jgi:DNA-nicking Smr family endonuclease
MARKKRRVEKQKEQDDHPPAISNKPIFVSPFKDLKKKFREHVASRPPVIPSKLPPTAGRPPLAIAEIESPELDDSLALEQAFEGVRRLGATRPIRMPIEPTIKRQVVSEDAEVMARLSDLVSGQSNFDITETDEYVEGMRVGVDPRLVVRLRRGEFATQAHIDLHGMIQDAARAALTEFILESVRNGRRCVLVVHGRGRGSPGGRPVLKHATVQWLSRGNLSGYVLAFTSARPQDGGAGALYVLLKRDRRRAPFDVLEGAKRRE